MRRSTISVARLKGVAVGLLLVAVAIADGLVRDRVLAPLAIPAVGRALSRMLLSVLVFVVTFFAIRTILAALFQPGLTPRQREPAYCHPSIHAPCSFRRKRNIRVAVRGSVVY